VRRKRGVGHQIRQVGETSGGRGETFLFGIETREERGGKKLVLIFGNRGGKQRK